MINIIPLPCCQVFTTHFHFPRQNRELQTPLTGSQPSQAPPSRQSGGQRPGGPNHQPSAHWQSESMIDLKRPEKSPGKHQIFFRLQQIMLSGDGRQKEGLEQRWIKKWIKRRCFFPISLGKFIVFPGRQFFLSDETCSDCHTMKDTSCFFTSQSDYEVLKFIRPDGSIVFSLLQSILHFSNDVSMLYRTEKRKLIVKIFYTKLWHFVCEFLFSFVETTGEIIQYFYGIVPKW